MVTTSSTKGSSDSGLGQCEESQITIAVTGQAQ
jgi:hypothetical protein